MGGLGISLTDRQTDRTFTGRDAGCKGCRAQECRSGRDGSGRIGDLFLCFCVFLCMCMVDLVLTSPLCLDSLTVFLALSLPCPYLTLSVDLQYPALPYSCLVLVLALTILFAFCPCAYSALGPDSTFDSEILRK